MSVNLHLRSNLGEGRTEAGIATCQFKADITDEAPKGGKIDDGAVGAILKFTSQPRDITGQQV